MTKIDTKSKKGFTIIEVVLVLAIAGLIFLMVFVALPNLQRTQRDTQRRNDLDRLSTSLTQYITNNNRLPNDTVGVVTGVDAMAQAATDGTNTSPWYLFAKNYLLASGEDEFKDPNGASYGFKVINNVENQVQELSEPFNNRDNADFNNLGVMVVAKQAKCSDQDLEANAFVRTSGDRSFAVAMRLEGNGIYCVDNH